MDQLDSAFIAVTSGSRGETRVRRVSPFLLSLTMAIVPFTASAADAQRISVLEQEVRYLQREVQALSRQLDELRNRPDRPARPASQTPGPAAAASVGGAAATGLAQWVDPARWRRLRNGMSELEVISALGPPSSMREEGNARVLLYAMELGSGGFLGGSVKLRERAVVEVRQPSLQ